jgi:thiol:disulfide interchange protein
MQIKRCLAPTGLVQSMVSLVADRRSLILLLLIVPSLALTQQASRPPDPLSRLRAMYPEKADAKKEISNALQLAAREHKRVLLVFGASWCFDCFALDYRFHQPNIQPLVDKNYEVVHVDIGEHDKNLDIARQYETPVEAVPALAVLDSNGKLLYSAKMHQFSAARNLDPNVIVNFLETWKPKA